MIVTRGLGGPLLVTWGYGGIALTQYDPYCPGIPWWGISIPTVSTAAAAYTRSSSLVVATASPYAVSSSPTLPSSSPIATNTSPYSPASSGVGQGSGLISKSQSPFTRPPKACG